jgi:hypothetical protein
MKFIFETKKYYKNNSKLTKTQGVLFMLIGLIIFSFIAYWMYLFTINLGGIYGSFNGVHDCTESPELLSEMNAIFSEYNLNKNSYSGYKQDYLSEVYLDSKIDLWNAMASNYEQVIEKYNEMIYLYNPNMGFYESCYDFSLSDRLDSESYFIDNEESFIGPESAALDLRIEQGY